MAADGGVFAFDDAGFFGSLAGRVPAAGIIGLFDSVDGTGYTVVDAAGHATRFGG